MSDSKGAAIDEILTNFANYQRAKGSEGDYKYEEMEIPEAKQAILAILAQEVKQARIDEHKIMLKMDADYHKKLADDREKGIYPISFGSASGAIANAGWKNYFESRIKHLERLG